MRIKTYFLLSYLLYGVCFLGAAQPQTIPNVAFPNVTFPNVALVSATSKPEEQAVIDLAVSLLATEPGVSVIDRHKIEEILAEQTLSATGSGPEQQALHLGRLLNASVFAVLQSPVIEHSPWSLSVFDARTGEMLAHTGITADNEIASTADKVVHGIRGAVEKFSRPRADRKPVSIVAIRNVDLGGEWDTWCMGIGLLLERSILGVPSATLLNRRHLEWVNQESRLQGETAELIASHLLLTLEANRSPSGGVRIIMRMDDGSGRVIAEHAAASETVNAADLAEQLSDILPEWMQAESKQATSPGNRLEEAKRFIAEAEHLKQHIVYGGLYPRRLSNRKESDREKVTEGFLSALAAAEAALALASEDPDIFYRAWNVFLMVGVENKPSDFHALWRCIEISNAWDVRTINRGDTLNTNVVNRFIKIGGILDAYRLYLEQSPFLEEKKESLELAIDETRHRLEDWVLGTVMEHAYSQMARYSPETFHRNLDELIRHMTWFRAESEYWRLVSEGYPASMHYLEDHPVTLAWIRRTPRRFARLIAMVEGRTSEFATDTQYPERYVFKSPFAPTETHILTLGPLFEQMAIHSDPVVNAYGQIGLLSFDQRFKDMDDAALRTRMISIRDQLRADILEPRKEPVDSYREAAYGAERDMIDFLISDPEEWERWHLDQYQFMLKHNQINAWTAIYAIHPVRRRFRHFFSATGLTFFEQNFFNSEPQPRPASEHPALLERYHEILAALEKDNIIRSVSGHFVGSLKQTLEVAVEELFSASPELRPDPELVWKHCERLTAFEDPDWIMRAVAGVKDQAVYVVAENRRRRGGPEKGLHVLSVPLDSSEMEPWGQPFLTETHLRGMSSVFGGSGGLFYISNDSFIRFPSASESPVLWAPESGYPSKRIQTLGEVNETLLLALDDGTLLGRRPADTDWSLIVSTRRPLPETKLDSQRYIVRGIYPDPAANRFLLVVSDLHPTDLLKRTSGIWAVHAGTLHLSQILDIPRYITGSALSPEGHILIEFFRMNDRIHPYTHEGVIQFDPQTDTGRITHALGRRTAGLGENLPDTGTVRTYSFNSGHLSLTRQGLWKGGDIVLNNNSVKKLPLINNERLLDRYSLRFAVPGTDQVLSVWSNKYMYLLELEEVGE